MKLSEIKLLTDENISPKVVTYFRQIEIDVLDVKEESWHGWSDEELLQIAYEQQRFVLTHDSDFGTLTFSQGKHCYGILYLRMKNSSSTNIINVIKRLFEQDVEILPHSLWVIDGSRVRIRRFGK